MARLPRAVGRDGHLDRGTWDKDADGRVWVKCGNGHVGRLDDHTIYPDGTVWPSVQCPAEGCAWHEDVALEGWVQ